MTDQPPARALMPAAAERFTRAVRGVQPDRWDAPTPCVDWTVRDLLNHLTSEHLWAPHLLRGETLAEVGDRYDGDVLGDDPKAAWQKAIDASLPAWRSVESDEVPVHVSSGEVPLGEYASQMLTDLTVHAWDLARGAGLDESLDPATVEACLAYAESRDFQGGSMFAPPVEIETHGPQDRLLALLGRDPR